MLEVLIKLDIPEFETLRKKFIEEVDIWDNGDMFIMPGVVAEASRKVAHRWHIGRAWKKDKTIFAKKDGDWSLDNIVGEEGKNKVMENLSALALQVNVTKKEIKEALSDIRVKQIMFAAFGDPDEYKIDTSGLGLYMHVFKASPENGKS